MINKELLSEVLKVDIRKINNSTLDGNLYYYKTFVKCKSKINIYELAHKCKEWAYKCGYIIDSGYHKHHINCFKAHFYGWVNENIDTETELVATTEMEAIIKACEWILKQKSGCSE